MTEHADVKMHKPVEVNLASIQFAPYNPRRISKKQLDSLKAQLLHSGCVLNLVVQRRADDGTEMVLIGGHQRTRALREIYQDQGRPPPDVAYAVILDLADDAARELNIALNKISGDWDHVLLGSNLAALGKLDRDRVQRIGFSASEINALIRRSEGPKPDEDKAPDRPVDPETKPGDLIVLGRHRLLCGDSTSPECVAQLLGDAKPLLMVTDPPYGVNYDPSWREEAYRKGLADWAPKRTGKVKNDDQASWLAAWELFPGNVAYVWHGALHAHTVALDLEAAKFQLRGQIIWAKQMAPMSRGHYHWRHEPCWYAVRKGKTAGWVGDRKQNTVWDVETKMGYYGGSDDANTTHGTQKPVEVMLRAVRNHEGDVYDPFLGSGTTLIAAEQLGRTCYAMEIDPLYADVCVRRWMAFTGGQALFEDGRPFPAAERAPDAGRSSDSNQSQARSSGRRSRRKNGSGDE